MRPGGWVTGRQDGKRPRKEAGVSSGWLSSKANHFGRKEGHHGWVRPGEKFEHALSLLSSSATVE